MAFATSCEMVPRRRERTSEPEHKMNYNRSNTTAIIMGCAVKQLSFYTREKALHASDKITMHVHWVKYCLNIQVQNNTEDTTRSGWQDAETTEEQQFKFTRGASELRGTVNLLCRAKGC